MLWIKSLHIVFVIAWFAGLFYLPRLFVYHAQSVDPPSSERFKLMDSGNTLQVAVTVDDPDAFNMPWSATQRWRRGEARPMTELSCAKNNFDFLGYDVAPIPQAGKPDF